MNKLQLLFLLVFGFSQCYSQKMTDVTLYFPADASEDGFEIYCDIGEDRNVPVPLKFTNHRLRISIEYFSQFATIFIHSKKSESKQYYEKFWVDDSPSHIYIEANNSLTYSVRKSSNCLSLEDQGEKEYNDFIENDLKSLENFRKFKTNKYVSDIRPDIEYRNAQQKLYSKGLQFIRLNPNLDFSFWIFRKEICKNPGIDRNLLLKDFESIFSDSLRATFEGNTVYQIIKNKPLRINTISPNFTLKDLSGRNIELHSLSNNFIVLSFWGPSCGPCIQEIPHLIKLNQKFKGKGLTIVSIAINGNEVELKKAIVKYHMDWLHLIDYGDNTLEYVNSIPSVFLINSKKEIIYYSQRFIDIDEISKKLAINSP